MSRVLLALMAVCAGCHYDLNDPGTDPLPAQLYFPSGLAADPRFPYLYVSNANADLRYGGGTVQVIDLKRFDAALADFRAGRSSPDVGLCTLDPIDPQVIDCDETPFIFGSSTVKVGNFAGSIRVQEISPTTRRLFVGVRGDPSITWINIAFTVGADGKSVTTPPVVDCFDNAAARSLPHQPPACERGHLIQQFFDSTLSCDPKTQPICPTQLTALPPEPFGLDLDSGTLPDGNGYTRLVVSHLSSGQVTLINAAADQPFIESVSPAFFSADPGGHHGAFSLAPQHPGQALSLWYLTSNIQPTVATFRIAEAEVVVPGPTFTVAGAFVSGADVRQVAFQADGNRAFLTENNPPSVVVVDTRVTPVSAGQPINQVIDIVDVCQNPSHLLPLTIQTSGPAGAPPRPQTRLYITCFLSNQMVIVDPDRPGIVDTVILGRGPTEIAYQNSDIAPLRRLYVTNFGEWTISMIDLDPGSPTENRVVARIGLPVAPQIP